MDEEDWDEFDDEEFIEDPSERIIRRLRRNDEISDGEEGFWMGFNES
jgi:hypothetical protein